MLSQKKAGYDLLKIHPGVSREAFDSIAATANRVGISFSGHVPYDVGYARALTARYSTIDHADGVRKAIPQVQYHPIERAAHLPHMERTDVVNPVLIGFLRSVSRPDTARR